mgnify:FL=1
MKKVIVLLMAVMFFGCTTKNATKESTGVEINGRHIFLYEIEGCEYIGTIYGANGDVLTHKGNCKFCQERNKR